MPVSLVLLAFALVGPATAAVIDAVDFEVPFDIGSNADWSIGAGQEPNINVVDAALSYERGAVTLEGGARALQIGPGLPSATTDNVVDWNFTPTTANDVWFSFLIQTSEDASTALPDVDDARDFFQLHFSEAGSQAQSLSMVLDNQTPVVGEGRDHIYRARAGSSGDITDTGQQFRNTPTETHLVVGHMEKIADEYETISLYVNPGTPFVPPEPVAMATFGGLTPTSMGVFSARISALEEDDAYLVDQITVGETYEDVVPFDPNFILGDFNADGVMDETDFDILADNLFAGTTYDEGDYDFNGIVDLNDFIGFREAFNTAGGLPATHIPEPASLLLLALGGMLFSWSRLSLR